MFCIVFWQNICLLFSFLPTPVNRLRINNSERKDIPYLKKKKQKTPKDGKREGQI